MLEQAPERGGRELDLNVDSTTPALFVRGAMCGKYRIIRLLARGGMSQVFEAVHADLRKQVAVKVLSPTLRSDREAHMRFAAEAINAAGLTHTNIVDVLDCGVCNGLPYLVTNLLVGCDLATLLLRRCRLRPTELVDILLPIADAIAFGHRRGVMHRDLKPENIFLHTEGTRIIPKLLDFGVSRMLGAPRITASISVVGTPHYMAPEQARAEKSVGPAADQYAMGVILYEALTGRLPRNAAQPQALLYSVAYGSFPPPSKYVQLPVGLERLVLRAMAPEPRKRFGSMQELAAALLPYASPELRAQRGAAAGCYGATMTWRESAARRIGMPLSAAPSEILDVTALFALLGRHRGFMSACLALLLMFSATCLWLAQRAHTAQLAQARQSEAR